MGPIQDRRTFKEVSFRSVRHHRYRFASNRCQQQLCTGSCPRCVSSQGEPPELLTVARQAGPGEAWQQNPLATLLFVVLAAIFPIGAFAHDQGASGTTCDPVTHVIAIGLTPAQADAAADEGLSRAEACPIVFPTDQVVPGCWEPRQGKDAAFQSS